MGAEWQKKSFINFRDSYADFGAVSDWLTHEPFVESDDEDQGPPMDMYPGWAKRMAEMQIKPNMELEANKQAQEMVLDRYKREYLQR